MSSHNQGAISVARTTLAFGQTRSLVFQSLLIGAAVVLPAVAHLSVAPVRILLPMHWPVILAGLVYGWRGGAVVGLLSPTVSYLVSGMPTAAILPAMTVELFGYGFVAGLLRERVHLNPFLSLAIALIVGRIGFMLAVLAYARVGSSYLQYFGAALLPGLVAAVGQIIFLPLLAKWWLKKAKSHPQN